MMNEGYLIVGGRLPKGVRALAEWVCKCLGAMSVATAVLLARLVLVKLCIDLSSKNCAGSSEHVHPHIPATGVDDGTTLYLPPVWHCVA